MSDCLFCKIINGEVHSTKVYEDPYVLAFLDIDPVTPVHILVIPKHHIKSAAEVTAENAHYIAKCFEAISIIAKEQNLENGFRVITNSGADGAQGVFHLHFHLLGGKPLGTKLVK